MTAPSSTAPLLALTLPTSPAILPALRRIATALEEAGLGAAVLDGDAEQGDLHPIHVAAALAPLTRDLALIPRTDAIDVEPFHLATQLMSLDHVSAGRAGWLVQARSDGAAAAAVGREPLTGADLAREAADVLRACRLVWDSWADDAVVRDAERGLYVDAARLQYVDFRGESFSVRGPSITPRSPQGQVPVLVTDEDADAVGPDVRRDADGRVRDVPLPGAAGGELPSGEQIVDAVRSALAAGPDGSGSDDSGADAPGTPDVAAATRLVRLTGLTPSLLASRPEDLREHLAAAAAALRAEGLIAPGPRPGQSLREQLGLPRPAVRIDPERRSDRARIASTSTSSTATPSTRTAA